MAGADAILAEDLPSDVGGRKADYGGQPSG